MASSGQHAISHVNKQQKKKQDNSSNQVIPSAPSTQAPQIQGGGIQPWAAPAVSFGQNPLGVFDNYDWEDPFGVHPSRVIGHSPGSWPTHSSWASNVWSGARDHLSQTYPGVLEGQRSQEETEKSAGRGIERVAVDNMETRGKQIGKWTVYGANKYVHAQKEIWKIRTGWTQDAGKGIVKTWKSIFGKKHKKKKKTKMIPDEPDDEPDEPDAPDVYPDMDPMKPRKRSRSGKTLISNYGSAGLVCGIDIPFELCGQFGD